MKHVSVMIKPASSLCNIRCKYCFYANISSLREVKSHGVMPPELTESMLNSIYTDLEDGDELTLAFQGGEPTLASLGYYKYLVENINKQSKKVKVNYSIQTNGMLINKKWCNFLKENNFLVGLSIDGHPAYHDKYRVDTRESGTFERVYKAKRLFDEYGIEYNVLCVLTEVLANDAKEIYKFIKDENIEYIQFIPCLSDLDVTEKDEWALTPKSFAEFYKEIFEFWLEELENGIYRSVKLFDDMFNFYTKGQITACGIDGKCRVQYVIESDGSVYPCDFYALDEYRMGYIQDSTLSEMFSSVPVEMFLNKKEKLPKKCWNCKYQNTCCGGCKRMKDVMYVDSSGEFCGYMTVLDLFLQKLPQILDALYMIINQ